MHQKYRTWDGLGSWLMTILKKKILKKNTSSAQVQVQFP